MGFGIILVGVAILGHASWLGAMNARARTWPTCTGVIIQSELFCGEHGCAFALRYDYEVGATQYRGWRMHLAYVVRPATSWVDQYPVGRRVVVFYDPSRPGRAVLSREPSKRWILGVIIGVGFAVLGTWLA